MLAKCLREMPFLPQVPSPAFEASQHTGETEGARGEVVCVQDSIVTLYC